MEGTIFPARQTLTDSGEEHGLCDMAGRPGCYRSTHTIEGVPAVNEPTLTLAMFRGAAREIIEEIARNRRAPDDVYAEQWGRLWSLLRMMEAFGPRLQLREVTGPWAVKVPDANRPQLGQWLVGGNLWLAIVLPESSGPEDLQLPHGLAKLLNLAGVEPPDE